MQDIIALVISLLTAALLLLSHASTDNGSATSQAVAGIQQAVDELKQLSSSTGSETAQTGGGTTGPTAQTGGGTTGPTAQTGGGTTGPTAQTGGGTTGPTAQTGGNNGYPGGTHTVPEINATAAPTALALLVGGLLLFWERSRRAHQTDSQS
ncbi:MAG: VPEID-CTERM sorting domain-containing protein [Candidatus Competibacteraceae bacterium]